MNTAKNTVIALLALTTIGGATLAWHQYQELVQLRASALDPTVMTDLQKRLQSLEKQNKDLQAQLDARNNREATDDSMAEDAATPAQQRPDRSQRGRGFRGQQFAAMREVMSKPEVIAAMTAAEKTALDGRYSALFKSLNLSTDQTDKLKDLLIEKQNARMDVMVAARDQGLDPRTDRDAINKLVADSQNAIDGNIKSLLGDSGHSQYTNYEETMPQRNVVNALQQRLSYTDSPLSSAQADQLVQILASTSPQRASAGTTAAADAGPGGPRGGPGEFGGGFGGARIGALFGGGGGNVVGANAAPITQEAVAQSQTVLTPTQVSALQQLQQQQQAVQQVQQMMRSAFQQAQAGQPPTNGGTGSTGTGNRRGGG